MEKLDDFTKAYIQAALWSSSDGFDVPLDSDHGQSDISPTTLDQMIADCKQFQAENLDALCLVACRRGGGGFLKVEQAGHDFWLTRNGHGAGFWDGDWSEPEASQLTAAAYKFGEVDLYLGDDGLIYA
jgi:hypothetical protein